MIRRVSQFTGLVLVTALATTSVRADEDAAKVTADAVRAQGFSCLEPISAQRDPAASKPDETVWILDCLDARYQVRFKGDTKAEIERLQ
jgi:hypothetical protein